jgi:uncharacterized protein YyaL (SSP411 family)
MDTLRSTPNHLADSLSPYLRQHATNPVDWYPWGDEALTKAKQEDRPIFLSIGYSACHWCHVMERESFENHQIAALLNQHFVPIKVDREERPDLDRLYMKAVQLLTGRGGWPMSVFLTADLRPFYGGTYFPPDDRQGLPGFGRVLAELARLWANDRSRLVASANQLMSHLSQVGAAGPGVLDREPVEAALRELRSEFDADEGGFGGAPKFPPTGALALLLREHERTGEQGLLHMVVKTLDAMARGGIYDHLGGGFHRYSVDDQWLVPHFEKMLYDNALLVPVYLDAWLVTQKPRFRQVAVETLDFVLREMTDADGGFHSTLDADSEGVEGKYYVWSQQEIEALLPGVERDVFLKTYGVLPGGNFEGRNILHLPRSLGATAEAVGLQQEALAKRLASARQRLFAARASRIRPHKDDKVLTSWNGLMISAFARGYRVLGEERYREAAERAAAFLVDAMWTPEGLLRVYRAGSKSTSGFLDDYAHLGNGLVDLFEGTGEPRWLQAAEALAQAMVERFGDPGGNGFFYSQAGDENLLVRDRCYIDEACPAPNAVAARLLCRLSRLFEREEYRIHAEQALAGATAFGQRFPTALTCTWSVVDQFLATPEELVIVGDPDDSGYQGLASVANELYRPNLTVVLQRTGAPPMAEAIPLLQGRTLQNGKATAYFCVDRTCAAPVCTVDELRELLARSPHHV